MSNAIDFFEKDSLMTEGVDISDKSKEFNKSFDSNKNSKDGVFVNDNFSISNYNISRWLGVESQVAESVSVDSVMSNVKQMYNGKTLDNGENTLGLKKINGWKSDISSKTGYAAEVVSTCKENVVNEALGNGIETYRADDRPDLGFQKNDQYVDKIRINKKTNSVERIQTKFVGKDAESCYDKLKSKKFDKYITDGKVDKIEIPKDRYDGVKKCISDDKEKLSKQLESAIDRDDLKTKEKIEGRIDKVNKLDEMLEQSNTTYAEAKQAAKNGRYYSSKCMSDALVKKGFSDGVQQAKTAVIVTGALSTVDNINECMDGNISAEEAVKNIVIDTGTAGAGAFSVEFISSTTSEMMKQSSNELIKKIGSVSRGNTAAFMVSYGVEMHDTINDYANGTIDNKEFADEMGRGAARVSGSMVGSSIGSAVGPLGSYYGAQLGGEIGEISYDVSKEIVKNGVDVLEGETSIEEASNEIKAVTVEKTEDLIESIEETSDDYKKIADYVAEETGLNDKVSEVKDVVVKNADEIADNFENTAIEINTEVVEKTSEVKEEVKEKATEVKTIVEEKATEVKTTVEEKATEVKETVEEKVSEIQEEVKEKADNTIEKAKEYQQSTKELVSDTVNYVITSEAYVTAVDSCEGAIDSSAEQIGKLETKAKEYAGKAIEKAGDFGADAVKDVKAAISDFNIKNSLPFKI